MGKWSAYKTVWKGIRVGVYFKSTVFTKFMIFAILYIKLKCAVNKNIGTGHTGNTNCNTNYIIILLILFITSLL